MRAWEHAYLKNLGPNSRQTLRDAAASSGLPYHLLAAARRVVSPDGQQLAVCVGQDIPVWNTAGTVLLRTLRGHEGRSATDAVSLAHVLTSQPDIPQPGGRDRKSVAH